MLTLKQIRDQSPCAGGWTKLQKSLGNPPMDTVISLGDIAKSNGAADAWWCVCALDWSGPELRREVIAALMPSVERAAQHTKDKRVHDCIAVIQDWLNGKSANLEGAEGAARAAAEAAEAASASEEVEEAAEAAWAACAAARAASRAEAACAVEGAAGAARAAAEAAWAAWAAGAASASEEVAEAEGAARAAAEAAEAEEFEAQRADIIAAFPPLVLT